MSYLTDSSLIGGFLRRPFYHAKRLVLESNYRKIAFLRTIYGFRGRHSEVTIPAFGCTYTVPDHPSFFSVLDEVYGNSIYDIPEMNGAGLIIDVGANVGICTNYFLQRYPNTNVISYEADPRVFKFLKANVEDTSRVHLVNAAVWTESGAIRFDSQGDDTGKISEDGGISVDSISIHEVLQHDHIDLLKMDIEGAENALLLECAGRLGNVSRLYFEYHSSYDQPQNLGRILGNLQSDGFRIHIHSVKSIPRPFQDSALPGEFEFQLNVFCWREAQ